MTRQPPGDNWIYDVNVGDFDDRVLTASQRHPVLVDFWAEWCAPCLVIAPVLAQVAGEYAGALVLARVEVDVGENMKLAGRYRVGARLSHGDAVQVWRGAGPFHWRAATLPGAGLRQAAWGRIVT